MTTYELKATKQKSYYGKANVIEHENGNMELLSYSTIVCGYYVDTATGALEFCKLWNGYSSTTLRHIDDFRALMGDRPLCKKEWDALPSVLSA